MCVDGDVPKSISKTCTVFVAPNELNPSSDSKKIDEINDVLTLFIWHLGNSDRSSLSPWDMSHQDQHLFHRHRQTI
jgi:hypothetical protein